MIDKLAISARSRQRIAASLDVLSVWTRVAPGTRRPRFHREDIAAAAIHIADSEGLDAVSMRRIAVELDAGTMTLYHYVRTKDELLTLVVDAVMGELVVPEGQMPATWREAITAIAHRSRSVLQRHSWILDIAGDPHLGPNNVRHFDQCLQAVASLGGELTDRLDIITAVDEYVFGFCLHERTGFHNDDDPVLSAEMVRYVEDLVASGAYPHLGAMIAEHGGAGSWARVGANEADPERFHRNLARILDGFEVSFRRNRPGRRLPR